MTGPEVVGAGADVEHGPVAVHPEEANPRAVTAGSWPSVTSSGDAAGTEIRAVALAGIVTARRGRSSTPTALARLARSRLPAHRHLSSSRSGARGSGVGWGCKGFKVSYNAMAFKPMGQQDPAVETYPSVTTCSSAGLCRG